MKTLFALLSSVVVSLNLSAQPTSENVESYLIYDSFESYLDTDSLKTVWTGFGYALDGEIYLSNAGGTASSQGAIYVGNWTNGGFIGAVKTLDNQNLTSASSVTVNVSVQMNRFIQQPATAPSEFRLGIEGSNGDIWESRVNQVITEGSLSTYTFQILESKMWKQVNKTGSDSLLDALASVSNVRLIFANPGRTGVQDFVFDDFKILPSAND